jgi:hypothetical protein
MNPSPRRRDQTDDSRELEVEFLHDPMHDRALLHGMSYQGKRKPKKKRNSGARFELVLRDT